MGHLLNISENSRAVLRIAQAFARENKNGCLGVSHLLRALMHRESGLHGFLQSLDKDISYLSEWAEVRIDECPKVSKLPDVLSPDDAVAQVMEEAENIRFKVGLDLIEPVCLLAALVKPGYGYSADQLKSLPLREKEILDALIGTTGMKPAAQSAEPLLQVPANAGTGALYIYCTDKNARVKEGKTDPVVGRDKELLMMTEVLGRRSKPNVLILGEPGVGKSALVDGFVSKVIEGKVPENLKSSIVFELEAGALLAGASYKGEVEDRLKKIIKDLKSFEKAILFIDEIHTLTDPKGPAGSGVANLLKPELARGELTIIGATTQEEFRKIIEPDKAFNRRFETLTVHEPDAVTAAKMVQGLIPKYEEHHKLDVSPHVIKESVRLAKRYIKDKRLPDAAADLLDRTMAAVKMMKETSEEEILLLEKEVTAMGQSELPEDEKLTELRWLYATLFNRISPILSARLDEQQDVADAESSEELQPVLESIIQGLREALGETKSEVTTHDLASVIAHKTGIPIGKVQAREKDKLLSIEDHLQKRVIGQDHAIKILSDTVVESRSGILKAGQPIGSFFFLGPTGTGKTELTKAIAEFLFNDEKAMIRFDMSEFKEEHSAALLYGAPPGYVGYEEGGMLVNKIRQKPYSVVLFDEIEKAHHSVFDIFLQIMDEGVLHDKLGKEGDFSNAIIIFTSNIGSEWVVEQFQKGLIPSSQQLMDVMGRNFRPEFLARLSEIVPFAPIAEDNVVRILDIQLASLFSSLNKLGVQLCLSEQARKSLALSGFTPKYGARQLSAVIRNRLRRPIARMLVSGKLGKGDVLYADMPDGKEELSFEINKSHTEAGLSELPSVQKEHVKL
ncbi:ATP-dependent Clp protease ATP-binding subunit [Cytophagaceae bacterium ABcell3]|nr:ATP-dependent Clp protease ATP-binding subunit [Cytophagaceae bacterium ABcell3]